jgi:glycerol-3-phosphate acyltransferase PlsY
MTFAGQTAILLLACYLVGGIPFGLIVSRLKGVDIRKHGSGNLGATNVGRVLGKKWGVFVLLLDASKGACTSIAGRVFLEYAGLMDVGGQAVLCDLIWLGTGLCCVIGNVAPVYLRFRGGKGVATTLGVLLGIYPYLTLPALVAIVAFAIVVAISRYISLGSIIAAVCMPPAFVANSMLEGWPLTEHYPLLGLTLLVATVVVIRHRSNIGRLLAGTENRLGGAGPGD